MECQQCTIIFTPRQKTQKFCSKTCKTEFGKYADNICEVCEKEYRGIKGRKYCSSECRATTTREERNCKMCDTKFVERIKHDREFCSNDCRINWSNIPENREKQQNSIKETVKEKYGVDHVWKVKTIHEKTMENRDWTEVGLKVSESLTNKSKEEWSDIVERRDLTKSLLYGNTTYNNPNKISETNSNKTIEEKNSINQKRVNTMKSTYGVNSSLQLPHTRQRMSEVLGDMREELNEKHRERREKLIITKLFDFDLKLIEQYITNKGNYEFQCLKCENKFHSWSMSWGDVPICRVCNPILVSKTQSIIESMLDDVKIEYIRGDRSIISPYEIDLFIPKYNVGIEVNGNYYHSNIGGSKDRSYHISKTKKCHDKNIKLLHIFEDEIYNTPNIIKSKIFNILGLSTKRIYARKCEIITLNHQTKKQFLNENHLQGNSVDNIRLGLMYGDTLYSVMTFSKNRISTGLEHNEGEWELNRFCSTIGYSVVGGFSKLLKYFIKEYKPKIITTYADIRWSGYDESSTVYNKNGFNFMGHTPPSYWYVSTKDYLNRIHRYTFRKSVLVNKGFDKNKTEWEIMKENGYDRIWDCGTMKFNLPITSE